MLGKPTDPTELIEALQAHAGLILRTAARVTGSMADAEDIAQDLAEKLLRRPPRDVRSWPALLKTMAVNAAIDQTRRRRGTGAEAEPVTHEGPESTLVRREKARCLREALGQLSERDAQLFSLCYLADLSHADIGRQLGMKPNAVSVALHRIRQRLADLVQATSSTAASEGEPA
ncbi:MAG: sigma-70 family RNA polymerase sigma factor [Xanthomonadales bacterium]|nr:sigma-70 family RNA polymerase sigma factor [Xanthomonadales bacterium]